MQLGHIIDKQLKLKYSESLAFAIILTLWLVVLLLVLFLTGPKAEADISGVGENKLNPGIIAT